MVKNTFSPIIENGYESRVDEMLSLIDFWTNCVKEMVVHKESLEMGAQKNKPFLRRKSRVLDTKMIKK